MNLPGQFIFKISGNEIVQPDPYEFSKYCDKALGPKIMFVHFFFRVRTAVSAYMR